jgi:hypothetical protein
MSRERCPRKLAGNAGPGFPEAVFLHLLGQVLIGQIGLFQLGFDMAGGPFGPFPLGLRVRDAPFAVYHIQVNISISNDIRKVSYHIRYVNIYYDNRSHFLLTKATNTLGQVFGIPQRKPKARSADCAGPIRTALQYSSGLDAYNCRRKSGNTRWECKACYKDFSLMLGTLFAKGKSALAMSRDIGLSYETAFVSLHNFREAVAAELSRRRRRQD